MTTSYMRTAPDATHFVSSQDGTKISYLTMGSGPAVIVIPGVLSTASDYTAFARALAEHFTVHIIERRGRGESGPQGADYSIRKECEDVFALQQKTGASFLVGHSFGGFVALEAARHNPSFTKLAVYEPGVSIDGSIPMDWIPGSQKKLAEKKYLDAFVEFTLRCGPERVRRTPRWLMKLMIPLILSPHELKQRLSLLHESIREHQETARLDGSYENYREITASVLLMYGGKSDLPWLHLALERLATVISQSETQEFPRLDHFGIDKKAPREVAEAVCAYFLK
ncbi:alpha/beta fold hydrolase [Dictyobacter aurantiacus]|uniref:Alpha/beta hydrolase n=1 Tax=Dictyobacter aurantiacus TaxID=1936993 RepID=A0A401ZJ36_9CHLR|nr:alpha/beta hydrolase [Dictyobacter aurantiacus]GCE06849.1 alpha/beta hydrolase [Dictyobacter aurantiacus]